MSIHPSHVPFTMRWAFTGASVTENTFCVTCGAGLKYTHGMYTADAASICAGTGMHCKPGEHVSKPGYVMNYGLGGLSLINQQAATHRNPGWAPPTVGSPDAPTDCASLACSCDMRDLMSHGHNAGCPAKASQP